MKRNHLIAKIFSLIFIMSFFFNSDVLLASEKLTYTTKDYQRVFATGLVKPDKEDNKKYMSVPLATNIPESFDWRLQIPGGLSPVFNQGSCGSCWANAVLGQMQDVMLLKYPLSSKMIFSRQELVSCDGRNSGCGGGWFSTWDYILKNGIIDEAQFPYVARNLRCKGEKTPIRKIKSWAFIGNGSEPSIEQLKSAILDFGPIAVTVNASFGNYSSGVFNSCNRRTTNHMTTLVGWSDKDTWIMKNSWGDWGEAGYMRIKMLNSSGLKCNRLGEDASIIILD